MFFSALETLPKLAFPKTLKMALPMAVKSCDCEISGATALNFFVSATHVSTLLDNFFLLFSALGVCATSSSCSFSTDGARFAQAPPAFSAKRYREFMYTIDLIRKRSEIKRTMKKSSNKAVLL